jgi:TetR/AcrR family transcriptional regulator, transcriptional repressor for nem operon
MRYQADQKAKARQMLLQSGTKALREKGFNGIGVDGLAASAGVTSGAFYSNFSGKEALLQAAIDVNLGQPFIDTESGTPAERRERLKDYLKMYISGAHRADAANGCVMPALSADVARSGEAVRETYRLRMRELIAKTAGVIGGDTGEAERRAWTIVVLMVGGVSIARALPEGPEAGAVLEAALQQAVAMIDSAETTRTAS